jgi:hypothetical protein
MVATDRVMVGVMGLASLALSACAETGGSARAKTPSHVPPPIHIKQSSPAGQRQDGLDGLMGRDAHELVDLFGPFQLDVREDGARKLQFANATCVLDAYLYPPAKGKEFVVTYVAARLPDGRTADAASCVSALTKK